MSISGVWGLSVAYLQSPSYHATWWVGETFRKKILWGIYKKLKWINGE